MVWLSAVSCGEQPNAPPPPAMPPAITSVYPVPRSVDVAYQTEIWAEMAAPLDPASVNEANVFLKADAARIPIDVLWVEASLRVVIRPRERLALRRTHTIQLTSRLRSVSGAALAPYFWQFTTNSVRALTSPRPADDASIVSPFSPLSWDSTETSAGAIRYSVYAGADSVTVGTRSVPATLFTTRAWMIPAMRWGTDSEVWWAVDTENLSTGEFARGPVWRFTTVSSATAVDSVEVPALQWGQAGLVGGTVFRSCFGATLAAQGDFTSAIDWDMSGAGAGKVLADASLVLTSTGGNPGSVAFTTWATLDPWSACAVDRPGPPYRDTFLGVLASGEAMAFNRVRFRSDRLTAHLQARIDGYRVPGYLLSSNASFTFRSPSTPFGTPPVLLLTYYIVNGGGS